MTTLISGRLASSVPVLVLVSMIVFVIMYVLPGDPVDLMLVETGSSAEARERLRTQLGLDRPLYAQYADFVWRAVRGDFGRSLQSRRPVLDMILSQMGATLELMAAGIVIACVVGVGLGTIAALRQNTWADASVMGFALLGASMPIFWSGLMLIYFFALYLGWFPATGQGGLLRLVLPAAALGLSSAGLIARLVRSSVLEVLRQDYVRTARAKGQAEPYVVAKHVLKNAFIPVITMIGLQVGHLIGGAVVTETVFARQGIGTITVRAILFKDFPVVQGAVFLTAIGYMMANFLVDLSYSVLDPRIRFE
jgi:ABC-type dipeptide/oligopeptide/nickel transport system permease component